MVKHIEKILAISTLLFILLIVIPGCFASENQTDLQTDESDVLTQERVDIYFDASASEDGNGSRQNPYKTIDSSKLRNNSNIYIEEGQYDTKLDMCILENCSIYGKNTENTIISSSIFYQRPNIITNGNFAVSNITFATTHFEVRHEFNAINTNFEVYSMYYSNMGFIYGLQDNINMNIDNCTFYSCFGNYGGAIFLAGGNLNIKNSRFRDNFVYCDGGAIWLSNSTATIINSTFEENRASNEGGAIYYTASDLTLTDSTFNGNRAKLGGAIYSHESPLPIQGCIFEANNATSSGGAVYTHKSNVTVSSSKFKNNRANSCGGSISVCNLSEAEIDNSCFDECYSDGIGAALYSEASLLKLNDVNVTNCVASFGSALTTLIGNSSLRNVLMKNNSAAYSGGAVYHIYGDISADNCRFIENTAQNGGAIYLSTVSISDFNQNTFNGNFAYGGSDICLMAVNDTGLNLDSINVYKKDIDVFIGNGNYTLIKANDTFDGKLPSRYSSLDSGYVAHVKNQGNGGYCWAFTAIGVLETCAAKASGVQYVFSENNLINLNKMFSDYGLATNEDAGTIFNALGYLLSWLGPVNETLDLYDDDSKISPVLNSSIHVQNILFLDINDTNNISVIKQAIIRYGAVGTVLFFDDAYCNGSSFYFGHGHDYPQNHAITLVGWDDNYSRHNFAEAPPADGAWIAKNSWGSYVGDKGYFYISYYSQSMHNEFDRINNYSVMDRLYAFIFNDTIRLDKNYQYDFAGPTAFEFFANASCFKNVFKASEDEFLVAVSTYFMQETQYDLNIYVNNHSVLNQSSFTKQGYYTINLDRAIPLNANDTFEVVFRLNAVKDKNIMFLISEASMMAKNETYRDGLSFFSEPDDSNAWNSLGNCDVFCIKAFTILNKISTSLRLSLDYDGCNPVNITATVIDEYQRKATYGTVTFNLDGQDYTVNVSDGIARITHSFINQISTVTATFDADGFNRSSDSAEVDVSKIIVDFDIDVSTYLNTANVTITASQAINETVDVLVNDNSYHLNLTNGKASLKLDNLSYGENIITAGIYDSQSYRGKSTGKFNITVVRTRIVSADFTTFENSNEFYSIKLLDLDSNPISAKKIKFNLTGRIIESITDSNGKAIIEIDLQKGDYEITTIFEGDEKNLPINSSRHIKVKELISISLNTSKKQNDISIDIALSKNLNLTVKVDVNSKKHDVNVTDGKGNLKLNDLANGDYRIAVCLEDEEYMASSVHDTVNINLLKPSIISDDMVAVDDDNDNFTVKLVNQWNSPLSGRPIKFNLNGTVYDAMTDGNGEAFLPVNMSCGNYRIITVFEGDDTYSPVTKTNNIRVKTNLTYIINIRKSYRSAEISLNLSKDVNADFIISVNGVNHTVNSGDSLKLHNLTNGDYTISVYLNDDNYIFARGVAGFNINFIETKLAASDITTYAGSYARYSVKLTDNDNQPVLNQNITYVLDKKIYHANTGEHGVVSIPINLNEGSYAIDVYFDGHENYVESNITNTITIISTIALPSGDTYTFNSSYVVELYDMEKNPLRNAVADIVVGGAAKKVSTDENGTLTINIDLNKGVYVIKVTNPETGEVKTQNINVKPRLSENKDISMYYGAGNVYKVKVLDDNGNAADGVKVTVKIGSTSRIVTTNSNGYASLKITQKPGTYTITSLYKGFKVSNKLTVKTTLITRNVAVKKGKTIIFTAKLLTTKGKVLKAKKVTFKFKGKTYKIKTNSKGIATLKLSSKKLKVGKYAVKATYGSLTVSNKITIKK